MDNNKKDYSKDKKTTASINLMGKNDSSQTSGRLNPAYTDNIYLMNNNQIAYIHYMNYLRNFHIQLENYNNYCHYNNYQTFNNMNYMNHANNNINSMHPIPYAYQYQKLQHGSVPPSSCHSRHFYPDYHNSNKNNSWSEGLNSPIEPIRDTIHSIYPKLSITDNEINQDMNGNSLDLKDSGISSNRNTIDAVKILCEKNQSVERKYGADYLINIARIIFSSKKKRLRVSEIYEKLNEYIDLSNKQISKWQNSVRNCLSSNKCFIKTWGDVDEKTKGCYWMLKWIQCELIYLDANDQIAVLKSQNNLHIVSDKTTIKLNSCRIFSTICDLNDNNIYLYSISEKQFFKIVFSNSNNLFNIFKNFLILNFERLNVDEVMHKYTKKNMAGDYYSKKEYCSYIYENSPSTNNSNSFYFNEDFTRNDHFSK